MKATIAAVAGSFTSVPLGILFRAATINHFDVSPISFLAYFNEEYLLVVSFVCRMFVVFNMSLNWEVGENSKLHHLARLILWRIFGTISFSNPKM